jgi:hypothetical protein
LQPRPLCSGPDRRGGTVPRPWPDLLRKRAGPNDSALAAAFEQLAVRRVLNMDDPATAAAHFNWLVMSIPLNRAMFFGDDETPNSSEIERYADAGVRVFLDAYGGRALKRVRSKS